jgi:hypothetical protein
MRSGLWKTLKERRSGAMTNEYEVAAVIELGNAQDVVLGQKEPASVFDSLDGEFGMRFIVSTDE